MYSLEGESGGCSEAELLRARMACELVEATGGLRQRGSIDVGIDEIMNAGFDVSTPDFVRVIVTDTQIDLRESGSRTGLQTQFALAGEQVMYEPTMTGHDVFPVALRITLTPDQSELPLGSGTNLLELMGFTPGKPRKPKLNLN